MQDISNCPQKMRRRKYRSRKRSSMYDDVPLDMSECCDENVDPLGRASTSAGLAGLGGSSNSWGSEDEDEEDGWEGRDLTDTYMEDQDDDDDDEVLGEEEVEDAYYEEEELEEEEPRGPSFGDMPAPVWERVAVHLMAHWRDVWALTSTCKTASEVRTSPTFRGDWLLHFRADCALHLAMDWMKIPSERAHLAPTLTYLLRCGCDPNSPPQGTSFEARRFSKTTPLHLATYLDLPDAVEVLLKNRASAECKDSQGRTPLHVARSKAVVVALRRAGANALDLQGEDGLTPLHSVCRDAAPSEVVEELLQAEGLSASTLDRHRRTPLHHLAKSALRNDRGVVALLHAAGADIDAVDEDNRTALHLAAMSDNHFVVPSLLAAGASTILVDAWNLTPLEVAMANKAHSVRKQLMAFASEGMAGVAAL